VFQYRLQIIAHDGIHFSLHRNPVVNDLITRYLITGPELTPLSLNRRNHLRHHRYVGTDEDDDWHYYTSSGKRPLGRFLRWLLFEAILGAVFFIGKKLLKRPAAKELQSAKSARYLSRELRKDALSILVAQAIIFAAFAATLGPWHYILFWIVPLVLVFIPLNTIRSFCEHSLPSDDARADRLFTFTSNPLERFVFAPHNMNLHYEHHVCMIVPYYKLPVLQAELRKRTGYESRTRGSYLSYLFSYAKGEAIPNRAA
jgi:fatty acid desaturase